MDVRCQQHVVLDGTIVRNSSKFMNTDLREDFVGVMHVTCRIYVLCYPQLRHQRNG